ncbi:MAG: tetratricopeptide repeat protein [Acidobacteriota bacterium]
MHRMLLLAELAFSLWLVVDAIRRRAAYYWYPIIMLPFGEWIYFFSIKVHDPEFEWLRELYRKLTTRQSSVGELRHRFEESPSFTNTTDLAQALSDQGSYREAAGLFTDALAIQADARDALYGLARCHSALGEYEPAIERYRELIALEPSYRDYNGYSDLADVLAQNNRLEEVHELLDSLVVKSPRLAHRVLHAHYLIEGGRHEQAREQLQAGLDELQHVPQYVRKKNSDWAKRAQQMLKQIPQF